LEPADYHGNPIDEKGSLVVTEWGQELCDFFHRCSGATTTAILISDMRLGLAGEFCEVFISNKAQSLAVPVKREPQTKSLQHASR
jgi:hypothetical protein